jgi:phosphoribosyl 1,2-cyclic phosphate phosphodiesterase
MNARVTVLGSGTSHGVPVIGCSCGVCTSADPRDRRTRPSIYVDVENGPKILVDTSTDLRQQALANRVVHVDAILFTHSHADHVMGLDDSRPFSQRQKQSLPCYADALTIASLQKTFYYVFDPRTEKAGGLPQIDLRPIDGRFSFNGVGIQPIPLMHGARPIFGFRFGDFAYLTDTNLIPEPAWPLLAGVKTVVLDALRHRPHPTHFTVAEALQALERMQPQRAYLTHICHDLPHVATNAMLPAGVELAYDGLQLDIEAAPAWT